VCGCIAGLPPRWSSYWRRLVCCLRGSELNGLMKQKKLPACCAVRSGQKWDACLIAEPRSSPAGVKWGRTDDIGQGVPWAVAAAVLYSVLCKGHRDARCTDPPLLCLQHSSGRCQPSLMLMDNVALWQQPWQAARTLVHAPIQPRAQPHGGGFLSANMRPERLHRP
jgi:hypothetical protein